MLFSHLRRGSAGSATKAPWFLAETLKRVPEGAARRLRADSGFYSRKVIDFLERNAVTYAITADQTARLRAAVEALAEDAWQDVERYGVVQTAEFRYLPARWSVAHR